jgi:hypothetical protein
MRFIIRDACAMPSDERLTSQTREIPVSGVKYRYEPTLNESCEQNTDSVVQFTDADRFQRRCGFDKLMLQDLPRKYVQ